MIEIEKLPEDDPGFIDEVQWMIAGCLDQYKSGEVYVVRIRDWFDHKWCYFSGKVMGAFGVTNHGGNFSLPPFVPNRILSQVHYDRVPANVDNYEASNASPLHINQRSEANFKRFIRRITNDGTIIWFSTGSYSTGRGSVMVYNVTPEIKFGWHATFLKKSAWQIGKVKFNSKPIVEGLRNLGRDKFR